MFSKGVIKILFFCLVTAFFMLFTDYKTLGTFYFVFSVSYHVIDVVLKRRVELINVWNLAFVFIILSEVFSDDFHHSSRSFEALQYLILSNNLIYLGYFSIVECKMKFSFEKKTRDKPKKSRNVSIIIIGLILLYFFSRIQRSLTIFSVGRDIAYVDGTSENMVLGSILSALGLILPAIVGFYYHNLKGKSIFLVLLLSSPIFLILFLNGTRFPMLFSIIGLIYVLQSKLREGSKAKKILIIAVGLVFLVGSSIIMKQLRSSRTKDKEIELVSDYSYSTKPVEYLSSYMSPEGVIDMTSLMFKYFDSHEYMYGESSSFLIYFWVPRSLWPDKPTMLGHWFIRKVRGGFSDAHSSSLGFTGDLYADFGMFSLFFVFFIGRALRLANHFVQKALRSNSYTTIIAAMVLPYTFFFVRSPITATINFLGILFFYIFFKKLLFKKA